MENNNFDFSALETVFENVNIHELVNEKYKEEDFKNKTANIIIAGKTGVGKSSLINCVFRENIAQTGTGKPISKEIMFITKDGVPISIYDTVGFELDEKSQKNTIKAMEDKINEMAKNTNPFDDIHCMWYCIASPTDRIEELEKEFINRIASYNIPVVLVLTKSYAKKEASDFEKELKKLDINVKATVVVLAKENNDENNFGLDQLVNITSKLLPSSVENAFANAQKVSIDLKRKKANAAINYAVLANFAQGFIPVPYADAPSMVATQTAMLAKITAIYGVDVEQKVLENLMGTTIGVSISTILGRTTASAILKTLPGAGTIVGGTISGLVSATITFALGQMYSKLMELALLEYIDLTTIPVDDIVKMLTDTLKSIVDNNEIDIIKDKESIDDAYYHNGNIPHAVETINMAEEKLTEVKVEGIEEDDSKVLNDILKTIEAESDKINTVNLIVAGISGVGKSTLINDVFNKNLATTGTGTAITENIELISDNDVPVNIYDTVGFELDKKRQKNRSMILKN